MTANTIKGSFYIRVRPTGWFVWYQTWIDNVRSQTKVADLALAELGFKPTMTVDEAKARCVQLNKERSLIRDKIRVSAQRVTSIISTNEILFPQADLAEFQELITEENFGSEDYLRNLNFQFNYIQNMCNDLKIQPSEYRDSAKKIYKYFIKQKTSLSYCGKLITFLNRWGKFKSKKNGAYFEPVPVPRGNEKSAITEAQQTRTGTNTPLGVRTESLPLSPSALLGAKEDFKPEQYNWLKLTVWFGLRPEEVDLLHDSKRFKIEKNKQHNLIVLHIYQTKLKGIAAEKRWKKIPLIFKEQQDCLEIIESGKFDRPLHKVVRNHLGLGITLYAGRKAFTDLMLSKGQKLEDISMWLGHKDISTTWEHYKNKHEINFTETKEVRRLKVVK